MKRVLVIGATGRIGRLVVAQLSQIEEVRVTAFSRTTSKKESLVPNDGLTVKGDLSNRDALHDLMATQDIIVVATSGDVCLQARQLVSAMNGLKDKRVIWVTGLGIHHEVPGKVGTMLNAMAKENPDYVAAADEIVNSGQNYLLLRCAALTDNASTHYVISEEGQAIQATTVSRNAVAHLISHVITGKVVAPAHASWGVTK